MYDSLMTSGVFAANTNSIMSQKRPTARLYLTDRLHAGGMLLLNKAQSHYLASVLRQKEGGVIAVFNGVDGEWLGEITQIDRKSASIRLAEQLRPQEDEPDIWLCFAPIKFGRIDFLAQKATELGASALVPVKTGRTIVSRVNDERLEANAIEAAEQSERLTVPTLHDYVEFEQLLAEWPKERHLIFADEMGSGLPILQAVTPLYQVKDGETPPKAGLPIRSAVCSPVALTRHR